jgi:hypothetical protein
MSMKLKNLEQAKKELEEKQLMVSRKPWSTTRHLYLAMPKKQREKLLQKTEGTSSRYFEATDDSHVVFLKDYLQSF